MVSISEAARQNDHGVTLFGEFVTVPDEVNRATDRRIERSDGLSLAVGPRELDYGDAGRASRHANSVGAAGGRLWFS